jgi:hypothetical protein
MTKVDQFESVFRAASKTRFQYDPVQIESVLVVTDRTGDEARAVSDSLRSFLSVLDRGENVRWTTVGGGEFSNVPEVLASVEEHKPGLVCTHRHLHSESRKWPYTLGECVDVLTQVTSTPVLLFPHPEAPDDVARCAHTHTVMAITDHMTGDDRLVNYATRFTDHDGTLMLTHIEDDDIFRRYIDAIGKIPEIPTEEAEELLRTRLLKDPADYIKTCAAALSAHDLPISVESIVTMGHHLKEYQRLIAENHVDLMVFNTKDDDQLAMHGLAYPLAIELTTTPLLML